MKADLNMCGAPVLKAVEGSLIGSVSQAIVRDEKRNVLAFRTPEL